MPFGAQPGDQISVVGLNFDGVFVASRYVIRADAPADALDSQWSEFAASDAFDQVKSSIGNIIISYTQGSTATERKIIAKAYPGTFGAANGLDAAAIIISRKVGDVWQRSTQRLVWTQEAVDLGDFPENVLPEWLAGSAVIDTVNPRYLNQAEQSL